MALASNVSQLYGGLVYVTPLAGGFLADRIIGRTKTVSAGAVLMVIGTFLLALNQTFLIGLACSSCRSGLLQGQYRQSGGRSLPPR